MSTLAETVHEHHDQLIPHVDELLETARLVGTASCEELRPRVLATRAFLTGTLIPHMEASERAVYPRLEVLLSDTGALAPLRREHAEVRHLIDELDRLCAAHGEGPYHRGEALALRRVLYRLHAIVRVHLDEEEMMIALLAHSQDPEEITAVARDLKHAVAVEL
jgi:plasmid stabilization system protein ParE